MIECQVCKAYKREKFFEYDRIKHKYHQTCKQCSKELVNALLYEKDYFKRESLLNKLKRKPK